MSRAIDQFIVVTDGNDNDATSPIHELIGYIRYHNHEIISSKVYSVFDYLYKNYAEAHYEMIKKYEAVSDYRDNVDILSQEDELANSLF